MRARVSTLTKRLLGLGILGAHLEFADGHVWITEVPNSNGFVLSDQLTVVSLNNKIYGGILEALDTIDAALRLCDHPTLEQTYAEWLGFGSLFFGQPGVDHSRITLHSRGLV